ncbi:MAG: hybrid sensor histidine kinase/response regulator [Anaerolineae bacterium]|nr:hybrid sensor histidine kinase/response regulator [Anaerolineae bacterium]
MNTEIDFRGRTILIVDDNAANLGVIADYLEAFDFRVLTAMDGKDALEIVQHVSRPDLILLDVMMPGIDGFETCRRLKADEQSKEIPVIFMTALAGTEDKVKGFEAGGVDYVTKPVNQEEVLARVKTHLKLQELMHNLQSANEEIKRFNQELEERVRRRTAELDQAYERLTLLDQNKRNFIQALAREMGVPIRMILDYAKRFEDDFGVRKSLTLSRYANNIYTSAMQLKDIINDIVQITAIESGTLELKLQPVSLDTVFQQILREFRDVLQRRRLEFKFDNLAALPKIEASHEHLHFAFAKLVENAIKYTPDGGRITINCASKKIGSLPMESLEIVVSDTGIGIDPKLHELVFTPFFHTGKMTFSPLAGNKTDFKASGAGLGLAIAQGIVQAHGGQIWVESPGYDETTCPGSRFHVVLPLRQGVS